MPTRPRAVLFVQHSKPHPEKQQALCLRYAEPRYTTVGICFGPEDCLALLRSGAADVVVVALDPAEDFAEEVRRVGAELAVARPGDRPRSARRAASTIAVRLRKKGMTPAEIAEVLEIPVRDVRIALKQAGLRAGE